MYALPYTRDHPHIRSPKGTMTCDEIRYWIRRLMKQHGWGRNVLSRTLGFINSGGMVSKLKASWIFPGEQVRCSRVLDRIISGELVVVKNGQRHDVVLADHPVPLEREMRMRYDLKNNRFEWVPKRPAPTRTLPGFREALGLRP